MDEAISPEGEAISGHHLSLGSCWSQKVHYLNAKRDLSRFQIKIVYLATISAQPIEQIKLLTAKSQKSTKLCYNRLNFQCFGSILLIIEFKMSFSSTYPILVAVQVQRCALSESQTPTDQILRSRLSDNLLSAASPGSACDPQTSISNSCVGALIIHQVQLYLVVVVNVCKTNQNRHFSSIITGTNQILT